jgi:exosome complex component RRP41
MEYVSFEGLRVDGRRSNECRRIRHAFAVDADADGSARFEIGNTIVQATVRGPRERRGRAEEGAHDACEVTATYGASAAADGATTRRKGDRKALSHAETLTKILDRVVMTELMPRSAIEVTCTVLCDDGGAKAASVNAATLALADAGVPLRDTVGAVTCGYLDGEVLVDLNREEERGRGPELLMCSTRAGEASRAAAAASDDEEEDDEGVDIADREVIAEELDRGKTTMETYDAMHDLALAASAVISAHMRQATLERTRSLAATRALEKF